MTRRTLAVVAAVALALALAWLAVEHSTTAHHRPAVPASVRAQLARAQRNIAGYCQGGGAWVEHKADGSWEVLADCPHR